MPRKEIDYLKTVIYKIVCNDLNITDFYVGHTTDFTKRKYMHKSNTQNEKSSEYNNKKYVIIRSNGDWNNWSMIEIEKYPCSDNNEARARERYWFEQLESKLNMINPKRNNAEYYEENKEKVKESVNNYRLKNQDAIIKKKKEDYIKNAEAIKLRVRQYSKNNKEKIALKSKEYYEANKEKINARKKLWYEQKKLKASLQ